MTSTVARLTEMSAKELWALNTQYKQPNKARPLHYVVIETGKELMNRTHGRSQ